jgi:hypothetical protein
MWWFGGGVMAASLLMGTMWLVALDSPPDEVEHRNRPELKREIQ